jgi:hypothetical protein
MLNTSSAVRIIFLSMLFIMLSGCQQGSSFAGLFSEDVKLSDRATQRWHYLIAGQWDGAYGFEPPAYRAAYSAEQFRSRYGSSVTWRSAKVNRVVIQPDGTTADIYVDLDYKFAMPGEGLVDRQQQLVERWVKQEGEWWHIRKK